jgi:hypothetical protein
MKWNTFTESDKEYPEKIAEKSIEGFSKATMGLAELTINPLSDSERISSKVSGDFLFNIKLISPYLPQYRLKIMTFGYDIMLNPIFFILEDSIHQEIYKERLKFGEQMVSADEKDFSECLEAAFSSNTFNETVTGLMKIAKKFQK